MLADVEMLLTQDPSNEEYVALRASIYDACDNEDHKKDLEKQKKDADGLPPKDVPACAHPTLEALGFEFPANKSKYYKRKGNKIPCRYYNRGRCKRPLECPYKHAPDDRSVRDIMCVSRYSTSRYSTVLTSVSGIATSVRDT